MPPYPGEINPKTVSSLIATLPTAAKLHRTIDEFYDQTHSRAPVQNVPDAAQLVGKRLAYFMIFLALGLANVGDAAEIGSMGFLLANPSFREEIVKGHDGAVAAALYIGMLIGGLLAGPLCDATGRRSVLLYGLLLNASFGVAAAISQLTWQLILCRLLMGLGIGGVVSCLLALTSEHTPPRFRGGYLNFVSAFWTVGSIFVAVLALVLFGHFDKSWRLFILINATPSLISFALVTCFVPESARFLALHGDHAQATYVANRIANAMGTEEGHHPLREDEIKAHYSSSPPRPSVWTSIGTVYKNKDTLRDVRFLQSIWFFMSFGSGTCLWIARIFYELPFVNHVYTMTFFFALASVPGVFVAGTIMDHRIGRSALLSASLGVTTLTLGIVAVLSIYTRSAWAVVLAACIFHSSLVVAWSTLSVVSAEVFPTSVRSTAMGMCAGSGRVASIIVHFVSAPLVENESTTSLLLMGTGAFALSILLSLLSQIKGKTGEPLQDTVGQGKQVKHKASDLELSENHTKRRPS